MPAWQACTFRPTGIESCCTADLAVDGDYNTEKKSPTKVAGVSVAHSCSQTNNWWAVDLGSRITVSTVLIHNREDCCGKSHYAENVLNMFISF